MNNRDIFEVLEELKQKLEEEERKASQYKDETILLKQDLDRLSLDKEKAVKEAEKAQNDAKLAKDFKGTRYEVLIKDLFEIPSEKTRRQAVYIFAGSIFASLFITYILSAYFDLRNSTAMEKRFGYLNESITQLKKESNLLSEKTIEINSKLSETYESLTRSNEQLVKMSDTLKQDFKLATNEISTVAKAARQIDRNLSKKTSSLERALSNVDNKLNESSRVILSGEDKRNTIKTQVKWIADFIRSDKRITKSLSSYVSDKDQLAIIYFLLIPNHKKQSMYYESYLEGFRLLDIKEDILPADVYSLVNMDKWFLRNLLSSYLISKNKGQNNWKYRPIDGTPSTYSNKSPQYNINNWGYQKTDNYTSLSSFYKSDLRAVISQLNRNDKLEVLHIPRTIYYASYNDQDKDKKIFEMFGDSNEKVSDSILEIDIESYHLEFTDNIVEKVQRKLVFKGFMLHSQVDGEIGPVTTNAIKKYQASKNLNNTGSISLELLDNLEIKATYNDLEI